MPLGSDPGSPPRPAGTIEHRVAATAVALVLGVGTIAAALAVVASPLFDLDRFTVPKETALLGSALLAGLLILARVTTLRLGVVDLALAAVVATSALSALLAANGWNSARSFGVIAGGATVFWASRFVAGQIGRRFLLGLVVLAIVAAASTGLAQAYGWSSPLWAGTRAPGGTLGNRNFLAHLAVIGVPLAGWLLVRARSWLGSGVAVVGLAALPAVIVLSRSRAAWVGLAAVVLAAGLTRLVAGRAGAAPLGGRLRLGLFAIGIGVVAALLLPNRLDWRSDSPYRDSLRGVLNYRDGSGRGRLIQYQNSLNLVRTDPLLGVGPGNWMVAYPLVTTAGDPSFAGNDPIPTNPWPSSDWIALLTERGTLGALTWLGFLGALMTVLLRRVRDPDQTAASVAAVGVVAAAASQGAFDAVLLLAAPTLVTMIGLGALTPVTREVTAIPLAGRRGRILAGFALVLGALTAKSVGQLAAIEAAGTGYPVSQMREALRYDPGNYRLHLFVAGRTGCDVALPHARRAAALLPNHSRPKQLLARCR